MVYNYIDLSKLSVEELKTGNFDKMVVINDVPK